MNINLKIIFLVCFLSICCLANPKELAYHGQLRNAGTVQNGNYIFYFELLTNNATAWEAGNLITQNVEFGYFNVILGDSTIMNPLPEKLFDASETIYLRTYVAAVGNVTNLLSPDIKINMQGYSIDSDKLGGVPAKKYFLLWTNTVIVAPGGRNGGGDFDSIDSAIISANARATANNPYTVFILPGTYTEPASITTPNSYVSIVGLSKDGCVLNGTLRIANNTLIENLTINPISGNNGIDITAGNPTINNVIVNGGNYGIMIAATATGATIHNVGLFNGSSAGVFDECGVIIDGLYVTNREAFVIDTTLNARYKNILHESSSGNVGTVQIAGGGLIRSLKSNCGLNVVSCGSLRIRDIHIETVNNVAMQIAQVGSVLEIYDGKLKSLANSVVTIDYDGTGIVRFDDVHFSSVEYACIDIVSASSGIVSFKDCDIVAFGTGTGINCQNSVNDVYVQCCRIRSFYGMPVSKQNNTTDLWVYDSTLYTGGSGVSTINCSAGGGGNLPRIADARLETDTNPSHGSPANWNAFGASGGVPGNPEDNNGNIVAPAVGAPITP